MRLHSLDLTAFGPFADHEHIDLDTLCASGLFLLHGPTGAGKTSVLDAICYALYGSVPGVRQQACRLRSDHADSRTATQVRLELTIRGRRLEVTRAPAWERPKRRGSGTTLAPAKMLLRERVCGVWQPITIRLDEAGQLLRDLLGMSAPQFCQVAMLPQGQFADFLRANAESRRGLLEQLFATERFSDVEAWLGGRRRESKAELELSRRRVVETVARVVEAAGLDAGLDTRLDGGPDQVDLNPVDPDELLSWASELQEDAAAVRQQADAARTAADAVVASAREELDRVRDLADRQRRHAVAAAALAALDDRARTRAADLAEIDAARRAAPVAGLSAAAERSKRELRVAEQAVAVAESDCRERDLPKGDPLRLGTRQGGALRHPARHAAALREEVGRLRALEAQVEEHQQVTAEVAAWQAGELADAAAAAADAEWIETYPIVRAAAASRLGVARTAAARVGALTTAVEDTVAKAGAAAERDQLSALLADEQTALSDAVESLHRARERWLDLRQRRLDGMAGELAGSLCDGVPCLVCGSPDHPDPARVEADAVSRGVEQEAGSHVERLEKERDRIRQRAADVGALLADARARAGGDQPAEVMDADLAARRGELELQLALAADETAADAALSELAEQLRRRTSARDARRVRAEDRADRLHQASRRLARLSAVLDQARGTFPSPAARAGALEELETACEVLALADQHTRSRRSAADDDRARLIAGATAAGFTDPDEASAARRDDAALAALETRVRALDDEVSRARAVVDDPEAAGAASLPLADVAAAQVAQEVADTESRYALAAAAAATHRHQSLTRLVTQLRTRVEAHRPMAEQQRVIESISELCEGNGANTRRMRLSSYVLAARLEQVADAASERLLRMSGGRYSLEHTAEQSSRGHSGLGLRVNDTWTGVRRDTSTLSGGETFFASLALALGLADVVSAEAGGADLDTLFVDEGFGSLDDDTLEEVMDVLDGLRAGGRAVGIVSHVADLRQRIPAQLIVAKGRTGSHLTAGTAA